MLILVLQIDYARATQAYDKVETEAQEASDMAGEGLRRLEEERQLRGLVSELESALVDLRDADRRVSKVAAVREMTYRQVSGGHQIQEAADGSLRRLTGGGRSNHGGSEPHCAESGSHDWNDFPILAEHDDGRDVLWSLGPMG